MPATTPAEAFQIEARAHKRLAESYLAFVASAAGQAAYTSYGFVGASPAELRLKPLD